jgi:AcrR family transcriptional regulator
MASDLSKTVLKAKRRVPQQDRGERRVAEVLEAAAGVIAERGYDGATMTEIAERAGSSIGALYQYFPNKEAIARALRHRCAEEMKALWAPLASEGAGLSMEELVDRMLAVLIDFMKKRPELIPLMNAPVKYERNPASRIQLRELFAALFRGKRPDLTAAEAFRVANVALQVVKGLRPLYAEAHTEEEREAIALEFKLLLTSYLGARLRV